MQTLPLRILFVLLNNRLMYSGVNSLCIFKHSYFCKCVVSGIMWAFKYFGSAHFNLNLHDHPLVPTYDPDSRTNHINNINELTNLNQWLWSFSHNQSILNRNMSLRLHLMLIKIMYVFITDGNCSGNIALQMPMQQSIQSKSGILCRPKNILNFLIVVDRKQIEVWNYPPQVCHPKNEQS
jgi:hypothetical protein